MISVCGSYTKQPQHGYSILAQTRLMYVHCKMNESCSISYSDTLTKMFMVNIMKMLVNITATKFTTKSYSLHIYTAYIWLDFGQTHMHDPVLKIQF